MARIVIPDNNVLWETIAGYLNAMFTEIYSLLTGKFSVVVNLDAGTTIVATTLTTEPFSVMILSSTGRVITESFDVRLYLDAGVYKLEITSVDPVLNVKIKLIN